jgi:hypothetical protein
LKRECHSKTAVQLKECSPKPSWSTSAVSVENWSSFMQNLTQTLYSILPFIAEK